MPVSNGYPYPGVNERRWRDGGYSRFVRDQLPGTWQSTESGVSYIVKGSRIEPGRFVAMSPHYVDDQNNQAKQMKSCILPNRDGTFLSDYEIDRDAGMVVKTTYDTDGFIGNALIDDAFQYVGVVTNYGCTSDCEKEYGECLEPPVGSIDEQLIYTGIPNYRPNKTKAGTAHVVYRDAGWVQAVDDIPVGTLAADLYIVENVVVPFDPNDPYTASKFGALSINPAAGTSLVDAGFGGTQVLEAGKQGGSVKIKLAAG